jgi:hypothetical protein
MAPHGSDLPAELPFAFHNQSTFVEKNFSAPADPFSELADSFQVRFYREAFDGSDAGSITAARAATPPCGPS